MLLHVVPQQYDPHIHSETVTRVFQSLFTWQIYEQYSIYHNSAEYVAMYRYILISNIK